MLRKISLPPELISLYFFGMVFEFGVLYLLLFSPFKNFYVIFLKSHGVYYGLFLDCFCSGLVHFIIHFTTNYLYRRYVKLEYRYYQLAMVASITTYTILGIPFINTQYGSLAWFFFTPLSCLISYLLLVGIVEKALAKVK